jgi:hypothetical protein
VIRPGQHDGAAFHLAAPCAGLPARSPARRHAGERRAPPGIHTSRRGPRGPPSPRERPPGAARRRPLAAHATRLASRRPRPRTRIELPATGTGSRRSAHVVVDASSSGQERSSMQPSGASRPPGVPLNRHGRSLPRASGSAAAPGTLGLRPPVAGTLGSLRTRRAAAARCRKDPRDHTPACPRSDADLRPADRGKTQRTRPPWQRR